MNQLTKTLLLCCISLFLISCGGTSPTTRMANQIVNGEWILQEVDYESETNGNFEIKLFDGLPANCIEGTTWKFTANNYSGNYRLTDDSCETIGTRQFLWSIPKDMYGLDYSILIKPVNHRKKSTMNNKGYRMQLSEVHPTSMIWTYDIALDGERFTLKLNFERN